jgi:hypothetical protein
VGEKLKCALSVAFYVCFFFSLSPLIIQFDFGMDWNCIVRRWRYLSTIAFWYGVGGADSL